MSTAMHFSPENYCFSWTDDGWYTWNREEAHLLARRDRERHTKRLKAMGLKVTWSRLPNQTVTRGGCGSNHPEVSLNVTVYLLTTSPGSSSTPSE